MGHVRHQPRLQPVLDAIATVEGLVSGLAVLVGRLSGTPLLDDQGIVRQIGEARRALDGLEQEVKTRLRSDAA